MIKTLCGESDKEYKDGCTCYTIESQDNWYPAKVYKGGSDSGNETTLVEIDLSAGCGLVGQSDMTAIFGVRCGAESSILAKRLRQIADAIDSYEYKSR